MQIFLLSLAIPLKCKSILPSSIPLCFHATQQLKPPSSVNNFSVNSNFHAKGQNRGRLTSFFTAFEGVWKFLVSNLYYNILQRQTPFLKVKKGKKKKKRFQTSSKQSISSPLLSILVSMNQIISRPKDRLAACNTAKKHILCINCIPTLTYCDKFDLKPLHLRCHIQQACFQKQNWNSNVSQVIEIASYKESITFCLFSWF